MVNNIKKGFTLFEIVVVIVILGIVSAFSADIISSVYQSYIRAQVINKLEIETSVAIEQISKRLSIRIPNSTIARRETNGQFTSTASADLDDYQILEWIPYSNESRRIAGNNGWSGLIDLTSADTDRGSKKLSTPGSNLSDVFAYINNLSGQDTALLVFKSTMNQNDFGWGTTTNSQGDKTAKVKRLNNTVFEIDNNIIPERIYEHYYLAHTAVALLPIDGTKNIVDGIEIFDLGLRYNYRPWNGQFHTNGNQSIIAKNVSLFRFREVNHVFQIKLCISDAGTAGIVGQPVVVCKEKVVL